MAASEGAAGRPMIGKVRTADEHADLLTYHISQIRLQLATVEKAKGPLEEAKAELKEKRDELSTRFDQAQIDLGRDYTRKYLEGLIADGNSKTRDLVAHEVRRARDKLILSQPVYNQQPELFPGEETPTAAKDEMLWEAEGYARGRRGDLEQLQPDDPPAFHQAILRGFSEGQKVTAERVARGMELRAQLGQPDTSGDDVDLNGAGEEDEEAELDAKAEALAKSGFMETSGGEDEDTTPAAA